MKRNKSGWGLGVAPFEVGRSPAGRYGPSQRGICRCLSMTLALLLLTAATPVHGQTPASAVAPDARTGLKAGLRDAGMAALNLDLVVNIPSPEGFYEPQGLPMPPGIDTMSDRKRLPGQPSFGSPRDNSEGGPDKYAHPGEMTFSNSDSDLAFGHNRVVTGGYHGFSVYDISDHDHPEAVLLGQSAPAARVTSRSTATSCSCQWSKTVPGSTAARTAHSSLRIRTSRPRRALSLPTLSTRIVSKDCASSTSVTPGIRVKSRPCRPVGVSRIRTRSTPGSARSACFVCLYLEYRRGASG